MVSKEVFEFHPLVDSIPFFPDPHPLGSILTLDVFNSPKYTLSVCISKVSNVGRTQI